MFQPRAQKSELKEREPFKTVLSGNRERDCRGVEAGIPYVPYFPLGGFNPLQSSILSEVAARFGATPMQVALAWLLRRAPNILLIPGTSSVAHLRENLASAEINLPDDAVASLNGIGGASPG